MPDIPQRAQQEAALQRAIEQAWQPFVGKSRISQAAFATAISKAAGPVLDETHRYAMIAILLMWMQDDSVSQQTPSEYLRYTQEAAQKQAQRLGQGMAQTNADWLASAPTDTVERRQWINDRLFSPARAERIAITETTEAISVGESIGREIMRAEGLRLDAYWETSRDDRVCSICGPLHGQHERSYELQFPDGPPAHPGCRCFLRYRKAKTQGG